ncbi:MAG: hypothetical protein Q7R35_10735 [Elusimicrobiota bacterium]|nr:hypothetical protein [Elusimicrobiota bacterium]
MPLKRYSLNVFFLIAFGITNYCYGETCNLSVEQTEEYLPYGQASNDAYSSCKSLVPYGPITDCPSPTGWRYLYSIHKPSGLDANVYAVMKTSDVVIAFRGTTDIRDWETNAKQLNVPVDIIKTLSSYPKWQMQGILALKENARKKGYLALANTPPSSEEVFIYNPQYNDAVLATKEIERRNPPCFGLGFPPAALGFCFVKLTGHSLGGGLAQYVAAYLGRKAVTFNSAGLSEETKRNIKSNQKITKPTIVNIRNSRDIVSAGVAGELIGEVHKCDCGRPFTFRDMLALGAVPSTKLGPVNVSLGPVNIIATYVGGNHGMDRLMSCMINAALTCDRKEKYCPPNADLNICRGDTQKDKEDTQKENDMRTSAEEDGFKRAQVEEAAQEAKAAKEEKAAEGEDKSLPCAYKPNNPAAGYLTAPDRYLIKSGNWTMGHMRDGKCE